MWDKGAHSKPEQLGTFSWPCSALENWEELHFDKALAGSPTGRLQVNLRWIEITPPVHPEDKWVVLDTEDREPAYTKGKTPDDERKGEWCDRYGFWHDTKLCSRDYFYKRVEHSVGSTPSGYPS